MVATTGVPGHGLAAGPVATVTVTVAVVVPPGGVGSIAIIPVFRPIPVVRHSVVPIGRVPSAS
jgi:hypothetical protein